MSSLKGWGKRSHIKATATPRLTPTSSSDSSSRSRHQNQKNNSRRGPSSTTGKNDLTILRGAALVRRSILEQETPNEARQPEHEDYCSESPFGSSLELDLHSLSASKESSTLDWASLTSEQSCSPPPPPPPSYSPPPTTTANSCGTPVTTMGRGQSLRLKVYTYHVQSTNEMDDDYTNSCLGNASTDYCNHLEELFQDAAYRHAQQAGYLWQTLVGQHVKFPSSWWDGARSPSMGANEVLEFGGERRMTRWEYISCVRVQTNALLTRLVKNRSAPGRLLLHIIVRDLVTWMPVQDICVGMYHPNARGVRTTESPQRQEECFRQVWMAVRTRTEGSVMESLWKGTTVLTSPTNRKVNNQNMRAIFGDTPPVHTIFMLESELYERIKMATDGRTTPSALQFLREFMTVD